MAIDFGSLLSTEAKRQLLEGRIAQFASEAYQYSLNLKTAQELGSEEQSANLEESLRLLESAINVHQNELASLPEA